MKVSEIIINIKHRIYFCINIIIFTVLFTCSVFAEEYGIVEGVVVNKENGKPLASASIFLKKDRTIGTLAGKKGYFKFKLEPGKHTIVISFTGMMKQEIPLTIEAGKTITITAELLPYATQFDPITISASRFERTPEELLVATEIVKPEFFKEKNITTIDKALDFVPGMIILDEEPQIRGGSGFTFGVGSKVNVLLDNIPLITGDAGKPDWNLVPTENLKQVEVIKGPGSVLSGANAMSGAVYLYTQYPKEKPETRIMMYSGAYDTPADKSMKWWNGWNYIAGVSFLHSRKFGKDKLNDIVVSGLFDMNKSYIGAPLNTIPSLDSIKIENSEMANRKIRLNVNYKRRSESTKGLSYGINGSFLHNKHSMVLAWYDDTTDFYRGYPGTVFLRNQTSFFIDPYVDIVNFEGTKHHIAARLLYNNVNVINRPSQSTRATTIYGLYEFTKRISEIEGLDIVGGVYAMNTFSSSQMYIASGSPDNNILNLSVYVEANKKFGESVNLNVGFRGEYYKINDTSAYIKPLLRTGINFKIFQETYLRMSYGEGYRFPSIAEKFISAGFGAFGAFPNPDLEPEHGWNGEIGIKQGFKFLNFYGYLDMSGFLQNYSNTVEYLFGFWSPDYKPAIAGFKFVNTGKSRNTGFELTLTGQSKFGKDSRLNVIAGYTYVLPVSLEPDYVFAEDYNPSGNGQFSYISTSVNPERNILKYRFLHTIKLFVSYSTGFLTAGVSGRFFSKVLNVDKAIFDFEDATKNIGGDFPPILFKRYYYDNNKDRFIFDINLGFKINENNELNLIVNNVLNTTFSLRPLKAEPMRNFLLQYQYKYN